MPKITEMPPDWQRDEFMGLNVANERAAHQILDNPKIFDDPLALRIIGTEAESKLRLSLAHFQQPAQRAFRAEVMVRNRYAEDELARSVQKGVRQYVILGAGLDTFAYRSPFPDLRVFEVDHPATLAWKRSYLEKAAIPIPASVTYVAVDLERDNLADALRASGFKIHELTFVSFIGVIRYLSGNILKSALTSIVSLLGVGSEVVFDIGPLPPLLQVLRGRAIAGRAEFLFDTSLSTSLWQRLRELLHEFIANRTFTNDFRPSYFDIETLPRDLKRLGFTDVQLFGPKAMNVRYCKDRTDGLCIESQTHLVKGRV